MRTPPKLYNHIPDICLVLSIVLAFGLAALVPQATIFPWAVRILGWLIFAAALIILVLAFSRLKQQHTSTNPIDKPSQLITRDVYGFSRNPLYLAYVLVAFGCALASGSWLALFVPIVCFVIIDRLIIPIEEQQMKYAFGASYARYAQKVRRWL